MARAVPAHKVHLRAGDMPGNGIDMTVCLAGEA